MNDPTRAISLAANGAACADGLDALFHGKDAPVRETNERIVAAARLAGPVGEEPKTSSVHLVRTAGFAGAHLRKGYFYLNLRADRPIDRERIANSDQGSKHRSRSELKLSSPGVVNAEVTARRHEAYALG